MKDMKHRWFGKSFAVAFVLFCASASHSAAHSLSAESDLRWQNDPKVIAFYLDWFERHPMQALNSLESKREIWDPQFVEPIVKLIESSAAANDREVLFPGLHLMDRNYPSWAGDPSIAPRLSRAVLRDSPVPGQHTFFDWADRLVITHDHEAITSLRPYLTDKRIDESTFPSSTSLNVPSGVTPMRNSESAANAICRLLGEPTMFDSHRRSKVPKDSKPIVVDHFSGHVVSAGGPYPEWIEWDKKIAALQERLAKLGYRAPVSVPK